MSCMMMDKQIETVSESKTYEQKKEPAMYTVVFNNDDFTPMDFVSMVLTEVFNLPTSAADAIMMKVHETGSANVGRFTKDIADTRAQTVNFNAKQNQVPLMVTVEAL